MSCSESIVITLVWLRRYLHALQFTYMYVKSVKIVRKGIHKEYAFTCHFGQPLKITYDRYTSKTVLYLGQFHGTVSCNRSDVTLAWFFGGSLRSHHSTYVKSATVCGAKTRVVAHALFNDSTDLYPRTLLQFWAVWQVSGLSDQNQL